MASGRVSKVKGKVVDIPTVPTIGTATAGPVSASVAFTASTKGGPVSTYTALSNPGSVTGTGTSSPVTVSGLTGDTAYTFTVRGNNATGSSEYSSASNSVTALVAGAYESIATTTLSGSQATITISSIPATFKHLQLRISVKNTRTGQDTASVFCQVNSDTSTANYTRHALNGNGTGASAGGIVTGNYAGLIDETPSNDLTSVFGVMIFDFIDYTNTNKYKTIRSMNGYDGNGNGFVSLISNLWLNTNAISTISFTCPAYQFTQYSKFSLYGIKG
jgi:hypothetical protein